MFLVLGSAAFASADTVSVYWDNVALDIYIARTPEASVAVANTR